MSGRIAGAPAGSSALPTPDFHPIRRELPPDSAGGAQTAGDALKYVCPALVGLSSVLTCALEAGPCMYVHVKVLPFNPRQV
jgi:hypothetical protein